MPSQTDRYEQDFYAWLCEQAALLRQGKLEKLDRENLAEELEALSRSEKREIRSRLIVLLTHRLKWESHAPKHRSRSWRITIKDQQRELLDLLEDSPSLQLLLPALLAKVYPRAVEKAAEQIRRDPAQFPDSCPWTIEELLEENNDA